MSKVHRQTITPAGLSVLLPTRGRPKKLARMLDSLFTMAAQPEAVEAVLRVDDDDQDTEAMDFRRWNCHVVIGPRQSMGTLNTACLNAMRHDLFVTANDDLIVRTEGWDQRIRTAAAAYTDGVFLLYPNDMHKKERVATFPILSRQCCAILGDPFPAAYRGACLDLHLMDIFKRLEKSGHPRMRFLEDVVFEHLHPAAGKTQTDATYSERDRFGDDPTFLALAPERAAAAERLAARIEGTTPALRPPPAPAYGGFLAGILRLLLDPRAPLGWRLRLCLWLPARRAYGIVTALPKKGSVRRSP